MGGRKLPQDPPAGTRKPPPPASVKQSATRFLDRLMSTAARTEELTPSEKRLLASFKEVFHYILLQVRLDAGGGSVMAPINQAAVIGAVNLSMVAAVEIESHFHQIRDNMSKTKDGDE